MPLVHVGQERNTKGAVALHEMVMCTIRNPFKASEVALFKFSTQAITGETKLLVFFVVSLKFLGMNYYLFFAAEPILSDDS